MEGKEDTECNAEEVLDQLQSYLVGEMLVGERARSFFERWAHEFVDASPEGEQRLVHMQAYKEYQATFEDMLMTFLSECAVTVQQFRGMCEVVLAREEEDDDRQFVLQMMAILEYPAFVLVMNDYARAQGSSKTRREEKEAPGK